MDQSSSGKIKLVLATFAVAMMLCSALPHSFALATSDSIGSQVANKQSDVAGNPDFILFRRGALNTRERFDLDTSVEDRLTINRLGPSGQKQIRVIQFAGPIKHKWIDRLKGTGAEIIGYIPNNAYLIRGDGQQLGRLSALNAGLLASDVRPIRWTGRLHPVQKIAPELDEYLTADKSNAVINVEIEILDSAESSGAIEYVNRAASEINGEPRRFLKFVVLSVAVSAEKLLDIARFENVLFINPSSALTLHDERSAQIVAANLMPDRTMPEGPGYMQWLEAKELTALPDFLIDFTDGGLDKGSTSDLLVHPGFRDADGHSRVVYNSDYTRDSQPEDKLGHGSLVASAAVGMGFSSQTDESGYMYGLGVDPFARFGQSRIFGDNGALSIRTSFSDVVSSAYQRGARVSNNSWGNNSNLYDSFAQEYDALARDAQAAVEGNQEMAFIFSAGNMGPGGHISSPGTAKNVITVASSENYRPEGVDSCNPDGGGPIGPDGADNALDILRFSAGGPVADGRAKPDITAPGTHIYGAASQATFFNGGGLCPGRTLYQPSDQRLYTWSSGTSLAAPHVTGAAALARKYFALKNILGEGKEPSPAMLKAYLVNSASYLTGENAGGDLPSDRQGWGLANLTRAFDDTSRMLVDQTEVFTESGQSFEIKGSLADRTLPLRVTLAWTDAPGMLAGPAMVNDLDLEITIGEEVVYRGNNFTGEYSVEGGEPDRLNNLESIYLSPEMIPEGAQGNFTITVRAANIAGDGLPGNAVEMDQDFALVVYNIADPIEPPPPAPSITVTSASFIKKVLTISGHGFTGAAQVLINGKIVEHSFTFNANAHTLSVKKKRRKLNLIKNADNLIVISENGVQAQPFTLRL